MADNRPDVYVEDDGTVVYRASSLGSCIRALVAIGRDNYQEAMGKERVELLERSAEEGNLHEGAVIRKLIQEGWEQLTAQGVVEIEIIKGVIVRGHTDGTLTKGTRSEAKLLEVKSMSNKRFDRWVRQGFDGFPKYAYQISAYMQAHPGMDVLYVVKRREDGFEQRMTIPHDQPPVAWKVIRKRVLTAESHRRKRASFPDCDLSPQERYWCPFFYLHDEEDPNEGAVEMTDEDLAVLADMIPKRNELKRVEDAGKVAEEERKQLDKEIVNLMGATKSVPGLETADGVVNVTRVDSSGASLDQDKLRAELGEDLESFYKRYQYSYPKVTASKKQPKKGTTK